MSDRPSSFNRETYLPVCELGEGATGSVKLFFVTDTSMLRAVKFSRGNRFNPRTLMDFTREVQTLFENRHPTINRIFSYDIPGDGFLDPWIELEFIPGGTVTDLIGPSKGVDATRCHIILYGVAFALAFLHARDVVHRDVKSSNVLLDHRMEPRLGDFGFAREMRPNDDISSFPHTVNYAAPEILSLRSYTNKVDVYSYGMMMYELRTGKMPFGELAAKERIAAAICDPTKHLELPEDDPYCPIYGECTQFDPDKRLAMKDVVALLEDASKFDGVDVEMFDEYRDRIKGFEGGDWEIEEVGTIDCLMVAAMTNPKAMHYLGWMFLKGAGVEEDVSEAARWISRAAEYGYPLAIETYREMIDEGLVPEIPEDKYKQLADSYSLYVSSTQAV